MTGYVGAVVFVVVTILLMFYLMRGGVLKERYTVWWIVLSVGVVVVAIFPGLLPWATRLLGFEVASNMIFFVGLLLLLLLSVQFSVELSKTEDSTRKLAEEVAILRLQLEAALEVSDASQHETATALLEPGAPTAESGTPPAESAGEVENEGNSQ